MELLFKVEDATYADPLKGIPNKNSRRYKAVANEGYSDTVYTWSLRRYAGSVEDHMNFFYYYGMAEQVGDLTYKKVLKHINSSQWYNFEYEPQEGDYLSINYKYRCTDRPGKHRPFLPYTFFAFIFKNGDWTYESYYDVKLQLIAEGVLYII